jgi:hypothetical protein
MPAKSILKLIKIFKRIGFRPLYWEIKEPYEKGAGKPVALAAG